MKVIWVYENISKKREHYSQFNLLVMFASVSLWKRNHPEDRTFLYTDFMTKELLEKIGVTSLWDNVEVIEFNSPIDKSTFWASSKLHILSLQNEPVIIMDGDTLVYKRFKEHLKPNQVLVSNLELGRGYYPSGLDSYVRKLSYRPKPRWKSQALNVSFLYLPDPEFTKLYANLSLEMMKEFTDMNVPNSKYLIFAEQLLLRHLLDKHNVEYKPIIANPWDCDKWNWSKKQDDGIWSYEDSQVHFWHYGPLKDFYKEDHGLHPYDEEIKMLRNCINFHKFIDISHIAKR